MKLALSLTLSNNHVFITKEKSMLERLEITAMEMKLKAAQIRMNVVNMVAGYGKGHIQPSLSMVEIITALYFGVLKTDPDDPFHPERDRFLLSKGHACTALYSALAERDYFPRERLKEYYCLDSYLGGHPVKGLPGIEVATGSLGHGLPIALGMALAAKLDSKKHRIFTLMGDGELNEGTVWEAFMASAHFKMDNLIAIVDRNRLSSDGDTEEVMALEPLEAKLKAFNWGIRSVDGHDCQALVEALNQTPIIPNRPSMFFAHTIKGKGIDFIENVPEWHSKAPSAGSEDAKECIRQAQIQLAEIENEVR